MTILNTRHDKTILVILILNTSVSKLFIHFSLSDLHFVTLKLRYYDNLQGNQNSAILLKWSYSKVGV